MQGALEINPPVQLQCPSLRVHTQAAGLGASRRGRRILDILVAT